jgi:Fur family ferric uptake transcriptional regulator
MTRQRAALVEVVNDQAGFRSAQEIHREMISRGEGVGLATVYRGLQSLARAGEVDTLRTPEGESLYRRCARRGHHHHLVCRRCGRTEEIDAASVESWVAGVAAASAFTEVSHVVDLFGLCASCAGGSATAPR